MKMKKEMKVMKKWKCRRESNIISIKEEEI